MSDFYSQSDPDELFFQGLGKVLATTAQVVDAGASLRKSPRSGVLGFSVLITEGVSDLYHFSCTQMSKRF